jgi:hypothetical protein
MAKQKMLTKDLMKKIPALYSQEKVSDPQVVAKFFNAGGQGTWFITEGSAVLSDGSEVALSDQKAKDMIDVRFFGLCCIQEKELGYVMLSDFQNFKGRFGLGIERDMYFNAQPLSEVK